MNERENARNVFGGNSGKVGQLSDITSDMWTPISAAKPAYGQKSQPQKNAQPAKNAQAQHNRPTAPPTQRGAQNKKTPQKKEKSGYVTSSTGYSKKQKKAAPQGRISQPTAEAQKRPDLRKRSDINIQRPAANNMNGNARRPTENRAKAQTERKPQGQRPPEQKNSQKQQPAKKSALTKKQQKQIKKQKEIYERGRKQGKSQDEIKREQQIRKIKKRKFTMFMSFVAFVIIVSVATGSYIYNKGAIVQNITVEGSSTYSAKNIIKNSGIATGDKLLGIREKRVKTALTENLPYIKDVEVSYSLPDTVVITVTPTEDKMLIASKNKYLRIDIDGKVLSASKTKLKDGLYRIDGLTYKKTEPGAYFEPAQDDAARYEAAKLIVSAAEKIDGLSSGVINVKDIENITFTYDSRVRIYLGDAKEIDSKLDFAMRTIASAAAEKQTGYIDMRFSERGYFSEGSMDNT